jgi:hypothetical protein
MNTLIGTPIDHKNIDLVKLLYELRQDIDTYCLISINVDSIKLRGVGNIFFWHLRNLVIKSIALNICNIYEYKDKYELYSIHGVIGHLHKEAKTTLDDSKLKEFIEKYNGSLTSNNHIFAIESTIKGFRKRYKDELNRFKTFRDKKVAHSEFGFTDYSLPSYDVMEKLFCFGADFYELVSASFVGVVPHNLKEQGPVKTSLKRLFQELGIKDIKTDMQ